MKYVSSLLLLVLLAACSSTSKKEEKIEHKLVTPNIVKEITDGVLHPVSVVYSQKHTAYYVSNAGYIAKYARDGKLVKSKWISGLKSPKGLLIVGDFLYVADGTKVQKINVLKGKIVKTISVKDSESLTDLVSDEAGNIYVSDAGRNIIFRLQKDVATVWAQDEKLAGPKGLFTDGKEHILAVRSGTDTTLGDMTLVSLKDPKVVQANSEIQGHLNGIAVDGNGMLWISDWLNGDIYSMEKNGKVRKMFNLGTGAADVTVIKELNVLIVPQMNQNKIIFIQL